MFKKTSIALITMALFGCGDNGEKNDTVTPNNTAPVFTAAAIESTNGTAANLDITTLVSDVDGDDLTIASLGSPTHGSVAFTGMVITYTPDEDFAGTDSFTATITDGKAETTATITVSAFKALTIKGKVVDEPVPNAAVSVTLNGQTFTATADENGDYTIEVKTTDTTKLVKVEATGDANDTTGIKLISLLGATSSLITKAGDDGILGDNVEDSTNVTNVTSARYILATEANNGVEITTDAELVQAEKSIDATQLIEIAAVIKVILDNPNYALPEGFANVIDFVSNSQAYNTFVDEVTAANPDDNVLTQTITSIQQDPELTQGFTVNTLSSNYILATAAAPGFLSRGGDLMELNADATGRFTNDYEQQNFKWSLNNNELAITFDNPLSSFGYYSAYEVLPAALADQFVAEYGTQQIGGTTQVTSKTYSRLIHGKQIDTVSVTTTHRIILDTFYVNGVKITPNDVVETSTTQELMRNMEAITPLAITVEDLTETWAAPTYYQSAYGFTYNGDLLQFNPDGTGNAVLSDRAFNWVLDNNTVTVAFADKTNLTVQKIDAEGELSALSLKTYDPNNNLIAFSYNFGTWHDDVNSNLTAEKITNKDNHLWATFVNGWMKSYWSNGSFDFMKGSAFGFDFNADGTAQTYNYFYTDSEETVIDKTLLDGNWIAGSEENDHLFTFTRCWSASNCQTREWLGLQVTDNQLIVMERALNANGTVAIPARLNIYRDWEKLPENASATTAARQSFVRK
ncbi:MULTISPECIES: Ig-like domain-containing protein [Shewanella]|uniref:Ig-like domain-containing protein n=1 Tax=Shewanella TaxID=22 RepID=UPI000B34221E|nr:MULTISPECIES: Ig-like domain-containing protein [Shewanella]MCT8862854.1 cadherin-like domain-containing protein [Shewanella xiamenensis]MDH1470303.1 Ig-like domain-containing protein [Shewanella sp. GD03713]QXN26934.1 cadherin-like domain-containing protein [Shewanella putrefaciens]VEE64165.1 Uncharacterised protein [Shewanella putrefaciens]